MISPAETGVVLITGCSSGLGHASAVAFQAAGYRTVATARDITKITDLAALGCQTLQLDVTIESSREEAIADVSRRFGTVGVLINNAGYGQYGPLEEIPLEAYRRAFETNVLGPVRMAQLVLPGMRREGKGRIVNVSSVAGRVTIRGGGVYHMTKYALEAMADAMRPEVKAFGIDVVNILPGPFVSRYLEKLLATIPETEQVSPYARFKRNLGEWMKRFLAPGSFGVMTSEHVARAVLEAATAVRPRSRYNVGLLARFGPLARALTPDRMVDAYMSHQIPST